MMPASLANCFEVDLREKMHCRAIDSWLGRPEEQEVATGHRGGSMMMMKSAAAAGGGLVVVT